MEQSANNGPGQGEAHSNNGIHPQLDLVELYNQGPRAITDEIRQRLRAMSLAAYITVFGVSILGRLRKKRSPATADSDMRHLRTVGRHWSGLSDIPIHTISSLDCDDLCRILHEVKVARTGKPYRNGSYNALVGSVRRLVHFLAGPPFLLLPTARRDELVVALVSGDPSSPEDCPLPSRDEEALLLEYIQQRCGRGKRLKSYIAFLLYLFFGIRRGMVRKIDRADVQLECSKITVTCNKQRGGREVRITFDMPPLLNDAFAAYIDHLAEQHLAPGEPFLKISSIARLLNSASQAAGTPHLTPKTFRKLFITRALQAGLDVATVALIVGHTDGGQSILNNYHQYCPEHINAGVKKVNAGYLGLGDEDWVETQRQRARAAVDVIVQTRQDVAAATADFLHRLQELIRRQQYEAVLEIVRTEKPKLPDKPSEQVPNLPKARPLSEARLIAANLRVLFWRHGLGYNEVAVELGLSKSIMYDIMRGTRQTTDALQKLADRFQVQMADLRNPALARYDVRLVLANVSALAARFGVNRLPCPETVTNLVEGRHLPPGNVIKQLADAVNVPLQEFLTQDLSQRPGLELRPCWRTRRPPPGDPVAERAKRENFAANLRLCLLIGGLNACGAAQVVGTTHPQMGNYVAGRCFPPPDTLAKIADYFRMSPVSMCGPAPELDAAAVGRRVADLVIKTGFTALTCAGKMGLAATKFSLVAAGEELPNGFQLQRICQFFGVTPEFVLGVKLREAASDRQPADVGEARPPHPQATQDEPENSGNPSPQESRSATSQCQDAISS